MKQQGVSREVDIRSDSREIPPFHGTRRLYFLKFSQCCEISQLCSGLLRRIVLCLHTNVSGKGSCCLHRRVEMVVIFSPKMLVCNHKNTTRSNSENRSQMYVTYRVKKTPLQDSKYVYSELEKSTPHPYTLYLKIGFSIIIPYISRFPKFSQCFIFST